MSTTQTAIGGFLVETANYTIESVGKYRLYILPLSYSDSIMTMGAQNRTHQMTIMLPYDVHLETLLDILNQPSTTLLDVEGFTHYVYPQRVNITHLGGQPGIYSLDVTFVEDMTKAPIPPLPQPSVTLYLTLQVLNSNLVPIANAMVTIGSVTRYTDPTGYAGPFTLPTAPNGIVFTLTVESNPSSPVPIPNAQVILQGVTKWTNSAGQVIYQISPSGMVT